MNIDTLQVRPSRIDDLEQIFAVLSSAFPDDEVPVIVNLVKEMLEDPTAKPAYSFVAESDEKIVGHLLFTSVHITESKAATACILAPLAVSRDRQGERIGTRLSQFGLQQLESANVQMVFVLGYPDYYSRFGFLPAHEHGLQAPYPIPEKNADAWMVLELKQGALRKFEGEVKCCDALSHEKYWVE